MAVGETEAQVDAPVQASPFNAAWFLKRLVLGTLILATSFGGLAWLTHAAIDPTSSNGENLLEVIGRLASQF